MRAFLYKHSFFYLVYKEKSNNLSFPAKGIHSAHAWWWGTSVKKGYLLSFGLYFPNIPYCHFEVGDFRTKTSWNFCNLSVANCWRNSFLKKNCNLLFHNLFLCNFQYHRTFLRICCNTCILYMVLQGLVWINIKCFNIPSHKRYQCRAVYGFLRCFSFRETCRC